MPISDPTCTTSRTATGAKPAGTAERDALLAVVTVRGSGRTITPPDDGFVVVGGVRSSAGTSPIGVTQAVFVKAATSAEPDSYTFTTNGSDPVVILARYPGAQAAPNGHDWQSGNGAPATAPSVNITVPGTRVLVVHGTEARTSLTTPDATTLRAQEESDSPAVQLVDFSPGITGPSGARTSAGSIPGSTYWIGQTVVLAPANVPPNAPPLVNPPTGAVLDSTNGQRLDWDFSDPDPGDSQSAYRLYVKPDGSAVPDPYTANVTSTHRDFAAGAWADGNYEWWVETADAQGKWGLRSASGFFTVATPPAGPSITAPTNGATVSTPTFEVTWSTPNQDAYQLRTVADASGSPDTGTVYSDTGTVSGSARAATITFPVTGRVEHIQLRVQHLGLWSPWASVWTNVAYTKPTQPTLDLTTTAARHVLVQVNNPPATGDQPAVQHHDIYSRCAASNPTADPNRPYSDDGTRVATGVPPAGFWTDGWVAKNVDYEYRAVSVGTTGATASGAWTGAAEEAPSVAVLDGGDADTTWTGDLDGGTA